jgi:hypothetical protein
MKAGKADPVQQIEQGGENEKKTNRRVAELFVTVTPCHGPRDSQQCQHRTLCAGHVLVVCVTSGRMTGSRFGRKGFASICHLCPYSPALNAIRTN